MRAMLDPKRLRPAAERSFVEFRVGETSYAIEIQHVREVVTPLALSALPHAPLAVAGLADHRGDVIAVVDLRAKLGLFPGTGQKSKWILVDVGGKTVGLVVDAVSGVFRVGAQELRPVPDVGGAPMHGISGIVSYSGRLIFVLDTSSFRALADAAIAVAPVMSERPRGGHEQPR
jgi:purine-binding chemotaxis protein CheW